MRLSLAYENETFFSGLDTYRGRGPLMAKRREVARSLKGKAEGRLMP